MAKQINREKEILQIMKDVECTRAEAEEIFVIEEKAHANGADKVVGFSLKERKAPKREKKNDADKQYLIQILNSALTDSVNHSTQIANPEREITFTYNNAEYSVTLTKHRPPKKRD